MTEPRVLSRPVGVVEPPSEGDWQLDPAEAGDDDA